MKKPEKVRSHPVEAFFEALVSSSDDAILSKDLNGIVLTWNEGAERMFGYTADEIVGRSITKLFPPDRLPEEQILIERIRSGERVSHYETVRRRKNGSNVYVSVTISPIRDADGNIIGASKIARDIGDQKEVQERLRLAGRALNA